MGDRDAADRRIPLEREEDIPEGYRATPVGDLIRFHNLGIEPPVFERPQLLVGMCMDHRKQLRLPESFAYVLRAGGANFRRHEFKLSFAIAVGGVRALALLAHTDCGMVGLAARREPFIEGLVDGAGWDREAAAAHFDESVPRFEIGDAAGFVISEAGRLRRRYPRITVAPLLYDVADGRLYGLAESG
jgi:carbonic anhydrase